MKKLILFSYLLLIWNCQAQTPKHEIQIGYGPFAREFIFNDAVGNFFRTIADVSPKHLDFSNAYSIAYRYRPRPKVAMGLVSAVASGTSYKNYLFESASHYKHTSVILAFEIKFIYMKRSAISLYSTIGLGGFLATENDLDKINTPTYTYTWPTAQLTPFGIRYGKKIGAFAEVGYGYKGIVNLGLSAKF